MEVNRCFGCMEEATTVPCPHCGYVPGDPGQDYALRPGTILNGKYLVGKILGQGGFGITYLGWDLMLERKVAIKEYYPSGQVVRQVGTSSLQWYRTEQASNARDSGQEMFLKEARKMSKVHKIAEVVQIMDLFQENDTAYIVMDFIEGETLKCRLQKTGPLSWQETQKIFLPVIRAMEEVHQAGLIHRDLSPDNLMLPPDGGVKILDLGGAKDLTLNSGASSMQVAKGGFSPPEQYYQRGGSGTWTDVYALAATIYYTLTGVLPPVAVERMEEDTLRWDLPQLQALPQGTIQALKKAMALRAKDRTQTMQELYQGIAVSGTSPQPEKDTASEEKTVKEGPTLEKEESAKPEKENKKWVKLFLPIGAVLACVVIAVAILRWKSVADANLEYKQAVEMMEARRYEEAIAAFEALDGFQDSVQKIEDCEAGILELQYEAAVSLVEQKKYSEAMAAFEALEGYKDSAEKLEETIRMADYAAAEELLAGGETAKAAIAFGKLGDYMDARARSFALWENIAHRETLIAGDVYTVGLKANGTVVATGRNTDGQCDVNHWTDIVAVSAGYVHTVGLKADGTVVAVGSNAHGQCNVSDWTDIVAVSAGDWYTAGLKADGTVVAVGNNAYGQCNVSDWRDCVAISAGGYHTIGLKANGTVVAVGWNDNGQCNISGWEDIMVISAGLYHTVGLKADGTVVAVGGNKDGQCDVSSWTDVVTISAGASQTVGLKADGTAVAVGWNKFRQSSVSSWRDCVAVSAGGYHTVGLKADGTVVAVGDNTFGERKVNSWKDMKLPN